MSVWLSVSDVICPGVDCLCGYLSMCLSVRDVVCSCGCLFVWFSVHVGVDVCRFVERKSVYVFVCGVMLW